MADPMVLLSYHPADEAWKDRIGAQLTEVAGVESWPLRDDADGDWLGRREEIMRSARVVVLLVSAAALASDYFAEVELPLLSRRRRRGEIDVMALLVEPCGDAARSALAALGEHPILGLDGLVLSKTSASELARLLARLGDEVREMLAQHPESGLEPMDATDLDALFERLYHEHYPSLVSFFGRRGLDPEVSRELAQDTMLRAYEGLGDFEGRSQPRTWIRRIALNVWRNWVRDHRGTLKREGREDSLEGIREDGVEVAEKSRLWPGRVSDPERRAVEKQTRERIRSRISSLPPRQRQCLRLWLGGSSYQEISEKLGVSMQTVRASLHKAKARIEKELGSDFQGATPSAGDAS